MRERTVSIITDWGPELGCGHFQRMACLAFHLEGRKDYRARLVNTRRPDSFLGQMNSLFNDNLDPGTGLIIRDRRDSTVEEIAELRSLAPVLVIDDNGSGRPAADFRLDLLPNPAHPLSLDYRPELFLFGLNFFQGMKQQTGGRARKNIDLAVYGAGLLPGLVREHIERGPGASGIVAFLDGDGTFLLDHGKKREAGLDYSGILLSSRVLLSHFGISLYEGRECGCRLLCLNPSGYHSGLAEMSSDELGLENLGVGSDLQLRHLDEAFERARDSAPEFSPLPGDILSAMSARLASFESFLADILG